jgi:hypothetical protein
MMRFLLEQYRLQSIEFYPYICMYFWDYLCQADLRRQLWFFFFFSKPDLGSQGFGDLLACIRDKNIPLQNMHFVVCIGSLAFRSI